MVMDDGCKSACPAKVPKRATTSVESSAQPPQTPHVNTLPIKFLAWNVMGLTTVKEELVQLMEQTSPDMLVLTETELTERTQRKSWLQHVLKEYWLHFSSCMHSQQQQQLREGCGGAVVAVKKVLVPRGCITRLTNQESHRSHLVQICLHPPGSAPLMVQGVYMPFDSEHRASIYKAVTTVCNKYERNVVLGDFNAVMYTTERSSHQLYPNDNQHKQAMTEGELRPTDRSARPYTFTKATDSSEAKGAQSRIDDILIGTTISDPELTRTAQPTDDSNRLPLMTTLDLGGINAVPLEQTKTEAQPSAARFTLPIKKEQLLMY